MPALTMRDFRARFDFDVRHAERTLLNDGYVAPLFIVTTPAGDLLPVMGDFSSVEAKDRAHVTPRACSPSLRTR